MVSIITPSYNSSRFIAETIQSVIDQTHTAWEMLIVDDCSKDNSIEIIQNYISKDERIKLIILDKNVGAAEARNIALRKANGQYIAFLDSDDFMVTSKARKTIRFMKNTNASFIFSQYQRIF